MPCEGWCEVRVEGSHCRLVPVSNVYWLPTCSQRAAAHPAKLGAIRVDEQLVRVHHPLFPAPEDLADLASPHHAAGRSRLATANRCAGTRGAGHPDDRHHRHHVRVAEGPLELRQVTEVRVERRANSEFSSL